MKIHLVTTSEFDSKLVQEIVDFIKSQNDFISIESHNIVLGKYDLNGTDYPDEFYLIPEFFREWNSISANDYVVALSQTPKSFSWQSSLHGNDIFILADNTKIISENVNEKIYFVYELIYNLLKDTIQKVSKIDMYHHKYACIYAKWEYSATRYKTLHADICKDCWIKALNNISELELFQMSGVFTEIKKQTKWTPKISHENIRAIELNIKDLKIKLEGEDGKEIKLTGILKTLYVFFLLHQEGVSRQNLIRHQKELEEIYYKVVPGRDADVLERAFGSLFDEDKKNSFDDKKSKLNKALETMLDEAVLKSYKIVNENGKFRINLPEGKIRIIE